MNEPTTTTADVLEYLAALNDGIVRTKAVLADIRAGDVAREYAQTVFERTGSVTWQLREFMSLPGLASVWLPQCEQVAATMDVLREEARTLL